jgi:Arc/MetJ-type ribon-helix-helix transcriptional regulator
MTHLLPAANRHPRAPAVRYADCMTIQIAVRLPDQLVLGLDRMVERGRFPNRTDAIRAAVERLVVEDREAELDEAIVAGYRAMPDEENDPWVEASLRAMIEEEPW